MTKDINELVDEGAPILARLWADIVVAGEAGSLSDKVEDQALKDAIRRAISSPTKSYRYVLPTQLLAKVAEPSADCRSTQVGKGKANTFDARTFCRRVVVPFERENNDVLGASGDPYVNNPLRVPAVTPEYSEPQRDKQGWEDLCAVLGSVEQQADEAYTTSVLNQVLVEIYRRLAEVRVVYPIPMRISLDDCVELVQQFLGEVSGGDRAQAAASALFLTIGTKFRLFSTVRRSHTNASDIASGQVADIECLSDDDRIVLAVEVKDKALVLREVQDKLPNMRAQGVAELIFLALRGVAEDDAAGIQDLIQREFASGHNLYVIEDFSSFLRMTLALLGEIGRRVFLAAVGRELDEYKSDIRHRRAWADGLAQF